MRHKVRLQVLEPDANKLVEFWKKIYENQVPRGAIFNSGDTKPLNELLRTKLSFTGDYLWTRKDYWKAQVYRIKPASKSQSSADMEINGELLIPSSLEEIKEEYSRYIQDKKDRRFFCNILLIDDIGKRIIRIEKKGLLQRIYTSSRFAIDESSGTKRFRLLK